MPMTYEQRLEAAKADPTKAQILQMAEDYRPEKKRHAVFVSNVLTVTENNPMHPDYVNNFRENLQRDKGKGFPNYWLARDWVMKSPRENQQIEEAHRQAPGYINPGRSRRAPKFIEEDTDATEISSRD